MNYESLKFRLKSVVPLVMHNGQLADPLNKHAREMKKISGKRAKTEADFEQLAKVEWYGGLYFHGGAPCLPGEMIEAAFIDGAKKSRRGQQAKAGILSDGFWPLEYDGPKSPDDLWKDDRFRLTTGVRVQRNRVMRTRPIFPEWAATVQIDFLPDQLDRDEVREIMAVVGRVVGIGDWRPRFGRFVIAA